MLLTWQSELAAKIPHQGFDLVEHVVVQPGGAGQAGHRLRYLAVLGLAEPDGRTGRVGFGDVCMDYVFAS